MIQLSYLDHSAVEGKSWLHRCPVSVKMIGMGLVLSGILIFRGIPELSLLYGFLIILLALSRISFKLFLLTFYPLIFAVLFTLVSGFQIAFMILIFLKVLGGSTGVVLLLATTPYPMIFRTLGRFLPSLLVTALFLTYRSVFILLKVLEETEHAIHLRGGIRWRHPLRSLVNISNAFGHLLVKGMDNSERMYEAMILRGFQNKIHYRGE